MVGRHHWRDGLACRRFVVVRRFCNIRSLLFANQQMFNFSHSWSQSPYQYRGACAFQRPSSFLVPILPPCPVLPTARLSLLRSFICLWRRQNGGHKRSRVLHSQPTHMRTIRMLVHSFNVNTWVGRSRRWHQDDKMDFHCLRKNSYNLFGDYNLKSIAE